MQTKNVGSVLELLTDYLSIGTLFRLRIALAHAWCLPPDLARMIARERLHLVRTKRETWDSISRRLATAASRCVECGGATQCNPRVCSACSSDAEGFRAMVSRREVVAAYSRILKPRPRGLIAQLCALKIVKVSRTGSRIFWRSDVRRVLPHL